MGFCLPVFQTIKVLHLSDKSFSSQCICGRLPLLLLLPALSAHFLHTLNYVFYVSKITLEACRLQITFSPYTVKSVFLDYYKYQQVSLRYHASSFLYRRLEEYILLA